MDFKTLQVSINAGICHVQLHLPKRLNAMSGQFFADIKQCFQSIAVNSDIRVVFLSGGPSKIFTAGLDLTDTAFLQQEMEVSRKALMIRRHLMDWQDAFTAIEQCPQPVIAAVHGACIGGGVDLICACDVRVCTSDASFCIKEVDIALAADLGTLQRCGKVMGNHSLLRELSYTARSMPADEAYRAGLVSSIFESKAAMLEGVLKMASTIAAKSPIAICGTKNVLNYSRDHSVEDGLKYVAAWNMGMLQTEDLKESFAAIMQKRKPVYSKL